MVGSEYSRVDYLINRLSSKKFYFTLFLIVLVSLMLLFGFIDKQIWKDLTQWVATVFLGADAGQEVGKKVLDNMRSSNMNK